MKSIENLIQHIPKVDPRLYEALRSLDKNAISMVTPKFVDGVIPVGTINGINKQFSLPSPPNPKMSLRLVFNGLTIQQGSDYTLTGSTVIMIVAPMVGDQWTGAWYRT